MHRNLGLGTGSPRRRASQIQPGPSAPGSEPWPPVIWPTRAEWRQALRPVYWTFTALVILTLAGSFFPYRHVVQRGHPWLPAKRCSGCPMCGMTRSFCALSAGRWAEAVRWNPGGPMLYTAGWLWLLGTGWLLVRRSSRLRPR